MTKPTWGALLGAIVVATGCGGGGATGAIGSSEVESTVGDLTTRTAGAVGPPVIVNSQNLLVTGMAGASFTLARINFPAQTQVNSAEVLKQTMIGFSQNGIPWLYDLGDGDSYPIGTKVASYSNPTSPAISPLGDRVYTSEWDPSTTAFQLYVTNTDGTGRVRLTTASSWSNDPDVSPDGSRVLFSRAGSLYVMPASGGTATKLTPGVDFSDSVPRWSADGSKIAFVRYSNTAYTNSVWIMNANGSSPASVASGSTGISYLNPDFTPSGDLLFQGQTSSTKTIYRWGGSYAQGIYTTSDSVLALSAAPDNRTLAFVSSSGGQYRIQTMTLEGTMLQTIVTSSKEINSVNWGPYIRAKSLIGNGGAISSGAGFLLAQRNKQVTGYVVFDATTRTGTSITSQDSEEYHTNLAFVIRSSDSLTSLRFSNKLFGPPTTVVTSSSPVAGALVTFDTSTGDVAAVMPYVGTAPSLARQSSRLEGRAHFVGLWTGDGKQKTSTEFDRVSINTTSGAAVPLSTVE